MDILSQNFVVLSLTPPCIVSCFGSIRLAFGYGERRRCEGDDEREGGRKEGREGVYSTFPRMMMSDSSARSSARLDAQVDDFPVREGNSRRAATREGGG